jgi:glycosyltransferase involved in cell wall biosynthesis
MKKILHIQVLPKLSGVQRVSLTILKDLPNEEYDKWVLFSSDMDTETMQNCKIAFEKTGSKVLFSKKLHREIAWDDISAALEIYALCKREKFDIVHTFSTKPGVIGRIGATFAHVPLVIHSVHGLAFHQFIKFPQWHFYWLCEMFASFFCKKIVLVNKYYAKYFKFFNDKLITIYNGIDFSQYRELPNVQSNYNAKIRMLFVGRLDTQKDPLTLLKAAKKVIEEEPAVQFTLVGNGEKYMECEKFIKDNYLKDNIFLEGWQNNVSRYYHTHQIFVASSIYEAFGLMFVEAGYYKLPCVTTNVEGIPEVVVNNVTGLLCSPRDINTLAQNILLLVRDETLRQSMGKMAHKRVVRYFSSNEMTKRYRKIYEKG